MMGGWWVVEDFVSEVGNRREAAPQTQEKNCEEFPRTQIADHTADVVILAARFRRVS